MLFNSLEFLFFLILVFICYWFVAAKSLKLQNLLILVASYLFYGSWEWKFLFLIVFSTVVDFTVGLLLKNENNRLNRKILLWSSIIINLGLLGVFKYYNFFLESLYDFIPSLKVVLNFNTLDIILPVGISFYTFQTMSYTIDVYNEKLEPTSDFVSFAAFVSFFPQLAAGPIERATKLLPQFYAKRTFDYSKAVDGIRQILWGLFMKVVIADNCAQYSSEIYNNSENLGGVSLLLGAFFFAFQAYGDFAGYSNIAIGTARLFGFDLMQNFNFPFFSRDIAEFWRRWHISLFTWFRDYLYIPLGGSRGGTKMKVRNTFIIFFVSGIWHGANWTFIVWGILNAVFFLPLLLTNINRNNLEIVAKGSLFPSYKELFYMLLTFLFTMFSFIFIRAENISQAFQVITGIFKNPGSYLLLSVYLKYIYIFSGIMLFMIIEWFGREDKYAIEKLFLKWDTPYRFVVYYAIFMSIILLGGSKQDYFYFQF